MEIYEQNMAFIKARLAAVYDALTGPKHLDTEVIRLPEDDNFMLAATGFRVFMHSRYSQERELGCLFVNVQDDVETMILFGFGNGKAIDKIREKFPDLKRLIIVDPNPEPLLAFLQRRGINDILKCAQNISFIINKTVEEMENLLSRLIQGHNKVTVIPHLSYRFIYPDYHDALWQRVYDIIRLVAVNTITGEAHRAKWVTNVWRNLQYDAADLESLAEMCQGIPAILISGGPSLSKNIHLLKQAKDRALLIAVGSTMTILSSHGIVPHFRMAIDADEANLKIFAKVDTAQCPLLYGNRLFHGILPLYKASRVHMAFGDDDLLEKYIFEKAEIARMAVASGFSVANTALDMLIKLGCTKIIFIGQDLCYTGGRLHASGAWDENAENLQNTDRAVDIFGNQVETSKPFLGMKDLFEILIARAEGTQFINATEGGLAIKGAPNKTLAEVLEQDLTLQYSFTAEIDRILGQQEDAMREKRRKISAAVDGVQAAMGELLERNRRLLAKLAKVEQQASRGIPRRKLATELNQINVLAKKQMKKDFFSEVIYPTFLSKFVIRGNKLLSREKDS
ncbi:MAG: DUF115 domain-containing protein, partial [Negativicutes bacterium]|nr:DUF115 domain-containing protein [Negativicutes bacterium]